jgi:hypothetical protein
MKKLVLFVAWLATFGTQFIAPPASAEPWTVGLQTPVYTSAHTIKDDTNAAAYGYEEADVASNFTESTWEHTSSPGGAYNGIGVGSERKARFDCNDAFEANDDPILFPGVQNGSLHKHRFFGNLGAAAAPYNATYASLRASGNSTCYGGPLNRSLYWEPEVFKLLANGVTVGVIPENVVTYYEAGAIAGTDGSRWPRGISMIFGFNMTTGDATERATATVAALNAAGGNYSTVAANTAGGFAGWQCVSPATGSGPGGATADAPNPSSDHQPWLKNNDGTATLNCNPGELIMEAVSYPCWDGVNLHAPDGRSHFMPYIRDNSQSKYVCPDNWVLVPKFRAKITFIETGQSDYTNWWLSSDRMAGMTQYRNGESGHADLIPAWSYGTAASPGIFLQFTVHCQGITVNMGGTTLTGDPHECSFGRVSSGIQIWVNEASPDGSSPNPLVNLAPDQRGYKRYSVMPTGTSIPGTVKNNH